MTRREHESEEALKVLLDLTTSPHVPVRIGGCYGLSCFSKVGHVRKWLRYLEESDADDEVRLAASLVLTCV